MPIPSHSTHRKYTIVYYGHRAGIHSWVCSFGFPGIGSGSNISMHEASFSVKSGYHLFTPHVPRMFINESLVLKTLKHMNLILKDGIFTEYQDTDSQSQYAYGYICRCVQYPSIGWNDDESQYNMPKSMRAPHLVHDQSNMTWMCLHKKHWSD